MDKTQLNDAQEEILEDFGTEILMAWDKAWRKLLNSGMDEREAKWFLEQELKDI